MCENSRFSLSGSHIFSNTEVFFPNTVLFLRNAMSPNPTPYLYSLLSYYATNILSTICKKMRSVYVSCSIGDQLLTDINYRRYNFYTKACVT